MRLAATILSATVAVVGVAVLALFLWLRTYEPLAAIGIGGSVAPGPGLGADVEPTFGSGGKTVFIPAYRKGRPFDAAFTIENTGRFAVTLTGITSTPVGPLYAERLFATDSVGSADPAHLHPFRELRLDPKESALIAVRWHLDCSKKGSGTEVTTDHVRLRYRYLSMFNRSQSVELPFAVTLRCSGGPPPTP
jgi:hypothetical protein